MSNETREDVTVTLRCALRTPDGKAVLEGDTVTARARLLHRGKTLHQWHIEISNEAGELISSVEVTNYIIPKGK